MLRIRSIAIPLALAVPMAIALAGRPSAAGDPEPAKAEKKADEKADAKADAKADEKAKPDEAAAAEPKLPEVTDAEALEIDITLVISLPLAADAARENGVDPAEVSDAITAVVDVGGSPADATEVLVAEADRAKKGGGQPNFGAWVRSQVAEGKRGKDLAAAIKKKKAEYKALSDEEKAAVDAKIGKLKTLVVERRKTLADKRAELVQKGKKVKVADATLKDLKKKLAKNNARKDRLAKLFADDPAKKEAFDKLLAKAEDALDKAEDKLDKAEDKLDKAEDKADKAEDKADKAEDKKDKAEDKKDKAEDKKADDKAKGKSEGKSEGKAEEKKGG